MKPEDTGELLHRMKMMETRDVNEFEVTRVPGGWIFRHEDEHYSHGNHAGGSQSMVFVPLHFTGKP